MRILLVTAMFPPVPTGTSFYSQNLAATLRKRGHEVVVMTVTHPQAAEARCNFPVYRLRALHVPLRKIFNHFRLTSIFPSNYGFMKRIARESGAQVILLVNHYLDIAFPAIFVSRRLGIPLICSVGTQLQSSNPWRHRALNLFDRLICGSLIFPFCRQVIAWDTQVRQYLSDVHGPKVVNKTTVVNFGPNGEVDFFLAHHHDYALHNQILGVGAVTEQRDFMALVRAFVLVADQYPRLRLRIVGHVYHDAAIRLATELGLGERVIFSGEQPHAQVVEEMKRSDAFFVSLSGRYLGLGTATIEAMLMGVPVIANVPLDLLGKAVLRDMEDIVDLDGLAPGVIAEKIRRLLDDDALRETIGRGGREFARHHLSWDQVSKDMEALLFSVVQTTRNGAEW